MYIYIHWICIRFYYMFLIFDICIYRPQQPYSYYSIPICILDVWNQRLRNLLALLNNGRVSWWWKTWYLALIAGWWIHQKNPKVRNTWKTYPKIGRLVHGLIQSKHIYLYRSFCVPSYVRPYLPRILANLVEFLQSHAEFSGMCIICDLLEIQRSSSI